MQRKKMINQLQTNLYDSIKNRSFKSTIKRYDKN